MFSLRYYSEQNKHAKNVIHATNKRIANEILFIDSR